MGVPSASSCARVIILVRIAPMLAVDLAQQFHQLALLALAPASPFGRRVSMKSSKLVSWRSPYCRRNSLKRGTPRSRSRIRSSAGTSICLVGLLQPVHLAGSAGTADGFAAPARRAAGGPC